jgi:four helix bundle protein
MSEVKGVWSAVLEFGTFLAMDKSNRKVQNYQELQAWQHARALVGIVYAATRSWRAQDPSLSDQMRRAVVSVVSNIAEGDTRGTNRDALRFLQMARGSLAELETQAVLCVDLRYLEPRVHQELQEAFDLAGKLLGGLIRHRSKRLKEEG